jgi:hypothetical protein
LRGAPSRYAIGSTTTVPAHSLLAPVRACVIAAALVIPGVCGVFEPRSAARTILMPCSFQSIAPPRLATADLLDLADQTSILSRSRNGSNRRAHPRDALRPKKSNGTHGNIAFVFKLAADGERLEPVRRRRQRETILRSGSIAMDLGRHPRVFRRWRVERVRGQQPRPENLSSGGKPPRQNAKRNPTASAKSTLSRRQDSSETLK